MYIQKWVNIVHKNNKIVVNYRIVRLFSVRATSEKIKIEITSKSVHHL